MIENDADSIVAGGNLHDCFSEGWGAKKPLHVIAEPIGFSGDAQHVLIKLAIPVLVMEQDNSVLASSLSDLTENGSKAARIVHSGGLNKNYVTILQTYSIENCANR